MTTIFISHRSSDNAIAMELRDWLSQQGHRHLFLDFDPADGIAAGADWEQTIYQRLRHCQAFLVVLTPAWLDSRWCFAELALAREHGKAVFVVKAKPVQNGPVIPAIQEVDLSIDRNAALAKLARGLKERGLDPSDTFAWDSARPIYPGLNPFEEQDAATLFGRSEESWRVVEVLERLRRQGHGAPRLVLVTGASGSGKSSLMRAGIIPRLRRVPDQWLVIRPFRRGADAITELRHSIAATSQTYDAASTRSIADRLFTGDAFTTGESLRSLAHQLRMAAGRPEATVLIAIDQMEEFLATDAENNGHALLRLLNEALSGADRELMAIGTVRSDTLGLWQQHPAVRGTNTVAPLGFELFPLSPLPLDRVSEIIRGPARYVNLNIDDDLIDAVRSDVGTADALPLLAYTLQQLYVRVGPNRRLTLLAYQGLGRLEGSIRKAADDAIDLQKLSKEDREILRVAFVPMLVKATGTGGFSRVRALREDLPRRADRLIQRLVDARLLVTDQDNEGRETIEVAHEALLDAWPPLREWLQEDRAFLEWRRRVEISVTEWTRLNHDNELLLRGAALGEAVHWKQMQPTQIDAITSDFIDASSEQARAEQERWKILYQRSLGRQLAAQAEHAAMRGRLLERSALLAIEAFHKDASPETDRVMRQSLALLRRNVWNFSHPWDVDGVAFTSDSKHLVTSCWDGAIRSFDIQSGRALAEIRHNRENIIQKVTFYIYGDQPFILTTRFDRFAKCWRLTDGSSLFSLRHKQPVTSAAIASATNVIATGSIDGSVYLWRADDGTRRARLRHDNPVTAMRFDVAGSILVTVAHPPLGRNVSSPGDQTVTAWNVDNGKTVWSMTLPIASGALLELVDDLAIVYDGKWVVVLSLLNGVTVARLGPLHHVQQLVADRATAHLFAVSAPAQVQSWDTRRLEERCRVHHEDHIFAVHPDNSGEFFVTGSLDYTARLWSSSRGKELGRLVHNEKILDVAVSPNRRYVATAGGDRAARVWEAHGGCGQIDLDDVRWPFVSRFSPNGKYLVCASDTAVVITELETFATVMRFTPPRRDNGIRPGLDKHCIAFSPDSRRVAVSGYDYAVYVLNIERGQQEMRFELDGFAPSVQFTPCGTMLGVASWDNSARMFSLDRREVSRLIHDHRKRYDGPDDISDMNNWSWPFDGGEPRFDNKVYRALFSADGKYLLTASAEGCVRVWECLSAEERVDLRRPGQAGTFSGDGQTLFVTNYRDGTLGAYRLNDGHEIFNVRIAQSLSSPEIAGKGEFIVMLAGSEAIIVEAETGKLVSRCQHDEDIRASSLSKDGYFLATGSTDRTVRVWDIPSGAEQVRVPLDSAVGDVDFRVDGGWLAVATEAAHLMLWRTNDLVAEAKNYVSRNLSPREWERFFGDVPYRKTLLNRP